MALNKSKTSVGTKIVLIFLIIAFVVGFIPIAASLFSNPNATPSQSTTSEVATAQYGPRVQALETQLASTPESYTILVNLGNTYSDWAAAITPESQNSTAALNAALPLWRSARGVYEQAFTIKKGDAPVENKYALMLYYLGDIRSAIVAGERAIKSDPKLVPGWLHLGNYYASAGENDKARAAWEKVIELSPNSPSANQAQDSIGKLSAGTASPTTTTP